jgi:hypothetical protein
MTGISTEEELAQYLFSDYTCAEVLSNEPGGAILCETLEVSGYELYIVEQWACERKLNTTITTYTGKQEHKITVTVVGLPKDTKVWSSKTRAYFDELVKLHSRPKETDHGQLFVTNLSSFPSNLNLVPVPNGNVRTAWHYFHVNENLRRAGCGGRLVLSIAQPPDACEDKFKQLFRTHDKAPILFSVRELVTLVQIGLFYCDLLSPQYVDGLLCNETLKAVNAWWDKWGQVRYRTKPKDGAFGATTVAAIIGFVTGVRNRVASVINYKTTKDPFDAAYFLESIRQFQKHEHLPRTMRIDDETVERLYHLTDKAAANSDLFGIVKSTMKEVSGKQVQRIADPETLDLDKLKNFLQGPRERYLWLGKGQMRRVCEDASDLDYSTGIPVSSLTPTELTVGNRGELKRVMKKTMSSQKQRTDDAIKYGVTKFRNFQQQALSGLAEDDQDADEQQQQTPFDEVSPPPDNEDLQQNQPPPEAYYDKQRKSGRIRLRRLKGSSRERHHHRHHHHHHHHHRLRSRENSATLSNGDSVSSDMSDQEETLKENNRMCSNVSSVSNCHMLPMRRFSCTDLSNCDHKDEESYALKRQHSFSEISDAVFTWTLPYEYPSERLVRTSQRAWRFKIRLKKEVLTLQNNTSRFKDSLKVSQDNLQANQALVDSVDNKLQTSTQKIRTVKHHVQDVEALAARLQYEIRTIDLKMKDVEESVETFQAKVTNVESRLDRLREDQSRADASSSKSFLGWFHRLMT